MSLVDMTCPNCGGAMVFKNNQFVCNYCNTMVLNIVDAKIDADVSIMSPEEFEKTIEKSKKQFIININDDIKVFDVDVLVTNKKIKDATEQLEAGRYGEVIETLKFVSKDILSAARLRLLADFNAKNEYELYCHDGYIDKNDWGYENKYYQNVLRLANTQTKQTYQKIAQCCRERLDTKKSIRHEIYKVDELLKVELYQEALEYAKKMCQKYPQTALGWAYACGLRMHLEPGYNGDYEYEIMRKCPDYKSNEWPPSILREKFDKLDQAEKPYEGAYDAYISSLGWLAGSIWIFIAATLCLYFLIIPPIGTLIWVMVNSIICLVKKGKCRKIMKEIANVKKELPSAYVNTRKSTININKTQHRWYVFWIILPLALILIAGIIALLLLRIYRPDFFSF